MEAGAGVGAGLAVRRVKSGFEVEGVVWVGFNWIGLDWIVFSLFGWGGSGWDGFCFGLGLGWDSFGWVFGVMVAVAGKLRAASTGDGDGGSMTGRVGVWDLGGGLGLV